MAKTPELITQQVARVKAAEARAEAARAKLAEERRKTLLKLHEQLGFDSPHDLIDELERLVGKRRGRPPGKEPTGSGVKSRATGKRTRITSELRRQVVAALADEFTGDEVAEKFGISLSSVNNIRRAEGLVRSRR